MNSKWSVDTFTDKTLGMVIDDGGNGRGSRMPIQDAQDIVDAHNRDNDPQWVQEFAVQTRNFVQQQLVNLVDTDSANYWSLVGMMSDTITKQLQSAVAFDLVKLKSDIINRGTLDGDKTQVKPA